MRLLVSLFVLSLLAPLVTSVWGQDLPTFVLAPNEAFSDGNALTNAVADFDDDGDLDLFVGFNGRPNRLYRNDEGTFVDVAAAMGIADSSVTRSAAWGDFDGDGRLDLFVAFVTRGYSANRLYRNTEDQFLDVTAEAGVGLEGSFRQVSWIDFDGDGDVDLFIGFRDKPNVLFRNADGRFTDVADELGVADPRKTVGAAWFDYEQDGDLDLVVANMDGDANGLFRQAEGLFEDVAVAAGIADGGRALGEPSNGTVRPTMVDFDNDGRMDIFMANYGPNGLFRNLGNGRFANVAPALGLAFDSRYDAGTWGDVDNDGRLDLFVNGTITGGVSYRDFLFRNDGQRFMDITPPVLMQLEADHGAHWADLDADGRLDLALTGAAESGMHSVLWNRSTPGHSLQVLVLDSDGRYSLAGAEVRVFDAAGALLGTRVLDTGSGYNSQNAMPVHFGIPGGGTVDVEVTSITAGGRRVFRRSGIDPADYSGSWLVIRADR